MERNFCTRYADSIHGRQIVNRILYLRKKLKKNDRQIAEHLNSKGYKPLKAPAFYQELIYKIRNTHKKAFVSVPLRKKKEDRESEQTIDDILKEMSGQTIEDVVAEMQDSNNIDELITW